MIYIVIGFLWLSICLYLILGGADFGAGIVELFTNKKARHKTSKIMYESIAPVWEANHMWLIIAIVVLFVGFPKIYALMSTYLHIPLILMLVGIIARGTAFTFRHYDAVEDKWQILYTHIFYYASLLTPFFLGLIAASTVSYSINPDATNFLDLYIFSWLNWFGVSVGLFTVALCAYLASVFSLRETKDKAELHLMIRKAKQMMLFVVITGALVFVTAYISEIPLIMWIFSKPLGIIAIILATIALGLIFYCMRREQLTPVRVLAGFQIIMILVAATYQHNPNIILLGNGNHISLLENAAPQKTLEALSWALMLGCVFILPFLFYLMYSFSKMKK
ncbi:cytochrome d ubiquinol oxidase subunit II [Elizabethkingia meningoseptica]|uniref:cytochrome d ubiquinol oxidase subunit II n=1 Tax=Elizabethkingia meningoseptica TaxID=238 RepID=UPI0023AE97D2|nr:cytochrome d ubiquinol oxidase subunit II [Elizabethkingia meningoseptica]MDE5467428.1 cytochrome d ubiquinol oxidase subunit II [Elizabethkingia meningoseptica]MDE5473342.1 cytochrome d ubiquinol oxidase subunit II [Elizabethkingia meningoseptica]MDE5476775.1 cytochrome d ubiquinol oxidase subunit II [Elizabethkingia meningoseptica]MDE5484747.1 cytochrome d ubiquinol oxidase subunit II [Elizabethkingia meningoseptica]MDE5500175.1 cytochrome d ubiquinol oxidase subunit II [Elizabethkingia m